MNADPAAQPPAPPDAAPDAAAHSVQVGPHRVHGLGLDAHTRCTHWHGPTDVVAIRMACCGAYYACIDCHRELADHPPQAWPPGSAAVVAVLCGACGHAMPIGHYLSSGHQCPHCGHGFNPGCQRHYPHYFSPADFSG